MPGQRTQPKVRSLSVLMMFHPTEHVTDLEEAEEFYRRVFGCESIPLASVMPAPSGGGHPNDYSTFTLVREVLFDSLDPKRFVVAGQQRYPDVDRPHLKTLGWYVDDLDALLAELNRHGIGVTNGKGEVLDAADVTPGTLTSFHAVAADAGIRYHFFAPFAFKADPRQEAGWTLPPPAPDDPLGLERCAHHVILTDQPERALTLVVDVLGGDVIHAGHDDLRGITGTFVRVGDAVLQYATPDPGSAAYQDFAAHGPHDVYHAVTWKVTDLDRAERHLRSVGVHIQKRSSDTIITEPSTSLGIPWGFTTADGPAGTR